MTQSQSNTRAILKNVRCSFPALFAKPVINGEVGKYGIKIMLHKKEDLDKINLIKSKLKEVAKSDKLKGIMPPAEKLCLREPDLDSRPEYEGCLVLSCNANAKPMVIKGDGKTRITDEEECSIYSGCRVNVKVDFWPQNDGYGRRINCSLITVQFNKEDVSLEGGYVSEEDALAGFEAADSAPFDAEGEDDLDLLR